MAKVTTDPLDTVFGLPEPTPDADEPSLYASGRYLSDRYVDFEWDDETSQYDPKGRWNGGDGYDRTYRCRVPKGLVDRNPDDDGPVNEWIERNADKPIWL